MRHKMSRIMYSKLKEWNIADTFVLLRADLNILDKHGTITHDFRIKKLLPTIDYILKHRGRIILLTHIGRPTHYDEHLSTQLLIPWFKNHGYEITFSPSIEQAKKQNSSIILLENLRFFPGEQKHDIVFAQQLAQLGHYYVNDAFGVMHRSDTSITLLPQQFDRNNRTIGFLVEKELQTLDQLIHNPAQPFVLILGGSKVFSKVPIIEQLLDTINTLLLCPAIVFTFAKARNKQVGNSLIDKESLQLCNTILKKAAEKNISVLLPTDYQVAHKTIDGQLSITQTDAIPPDYIGISIGPKTIEHFSTIIASAGTIFFNGAIGFLHRKETRTGMEALFQAMGNSNGKSIIAGGDSVVAAYHFCLEKKIDHLSTGGGATLAYISGKKLPGLELLKNRAKT